MKTLVYLCILWIKRIRVKKKALCTGLGKRAAGRLQAAD
jgi:hypothetical protein